MPRHKYGTYRPRVHEIGKLEGVRVGDFARLIPMVLKKLCTPRNDMERGDPPNEDAAPMVYPCQLIEVEIQGEGQRKEGEWTGFQRQ